jgi:hypothetical protein
MKKTFNSYSDPAHGWVQVPLHILVSLGIEDKISRYSYQKGENVYLEEDGDASLFVETFEKVNGCLPIFKHNSTNRQSKIRNYDSYEYLTGEQKAELADLKTRMLRSKHWNPKAIRTINNSSLATLKYWQGEYGF